MYIGARKYTTYNTFINICAYLLVSIFLIKEINLIYFLLSFVVLMIFYIFNVFSMERGRFTLIDIINALVANGVAVIITFREFELKNSISIFLILYLWQNISKSFIYKLFVKRKSVMIVGDNENASILRSILFEKQNYQIAEELKPKDYEKFEKLITDKEIGKLIITETIDEKSFTDTILRLKLKGIQVFDFISFYEK
ncbi:MAG: hypothetical protein KA080_03905, partial [Leptotrichiaceae bacterium]|nr:hypothetical protein [Leptotrichiaceae bacterium]